MIAFIYLTGMRVGAVISLRCKHVKLADRQILQNAREVNTKFGRNMLTSWFPVGEDIEQIVVAWVKERLEGGADPDAPLFPSRPGLASGSLGTIRGRRRRSGKPPNRCARSSGQPAGALALTTSIHTLFAIR